MKKTQKRLLGLFGLGLVVATTAFAAALPGPEASAVTTESVTDTIKVRVVGQVPNIDITSPESGVAFVTPQQTLNVSYENVKDLDVKISYTGDDDVQHNFSLFDGVIDVNYAASNLVVNMDLVTGSYTYSYEYSDDESVLYPVTGEGQLPYYGYGEYAVSISGESLEGVADSDSITFGYYPVSASLSMDEDAERIYVDLNYRAYDPANPDSGNVARIAIYVYDENGNLVENSPVMVYPDQTRVPFGYGDRLASGTYRFEIFAYNEKDELLYGKPFVLTTDYTIIPVPDTGGLFQNLNISKTDYLVTGLIIFFIVAVFGFVFIAKNNKKQKSRLGSRRKH